MIKLSLKPIGMQLLDLKAKHSELISGDLRCKDIFYYGTKQGVQKVPEHLNNCLMVLTNTTHCTGVRFYFPPTPCLLTQKE